LNGAADGYSVFGYSIYGKAFKVLHDNGVRGLAILEVVLIP
jgi:hypothetical protein